MKRFLVVLAVIIVILQQLSFFVFADDAEVIGNTESMLSMIGSMREESTLGKASADAVRKSCNTDIAILPGELFYMNLAAGDITEDLLEQAYLKDVSISTAEITPRQLKTIIEIGVGQIVIGYGDVIDEEKSDFEGFPQISGFGVKCDYSCPAGERVESITLDDGTELNLNDDETLLTLAEPDEMFSGGYGYPVIEATLTSETLFSCVRAQLAAGTIENPDDTRMKIIGIQGNFLMQNVSPIIPVLIMAFILAAAVVSTGRKRKSMLIMKDKENYEI